MTDLDDRIKTLLDERARDHVTDPRLPRTVVTRSRRRRALVGAGAGLAAVAAIVVGAAALREVAFEQETGDSPSVTPAPEPGPPETFVGVLGGDIVVADAGSGEPIRVLVDRADLGGAGALDLEVSTDGSAVYYVPAGTPELIMRVPLAGGEPSLVAEGRKPALSGDGRFLAYVDCQSPFTGCGNAIVLLDLSSGDRQRWVAGGSDRYVGQLAWLPDDRTLAYSIFYADSNPTTHLLDTVGDAGAVLGQLPAIGPGRLDAGWTVVAYHAPTHGILVHHFCCSARPTDEYDETDVRSVSRGGEIIATLVEGEWLDVELDASGRYVLLTDLGRDVYRLDASGAPVLVAEGFEDIDW